MKKVRFIITSLITVCIILSLLGGLETARATDQNDNDTSEEVVTDEITDAEEYPVQCKTLRSKALYKKGFYDAKFMMEWGFASLGEDCTVLEEIAFSFVEDCLPDILGKYPGNNQFCQAGGFGDGIIDAFKKICLPICCKEGELAGKIRAKLYCQMASRIGKSGFKPTKLYEFVRVLPTRCDWKFQECCDQAFDNCTYNHPCDPPGTECQPFCAGDDWGEIHEMMRETTCTAPIPIELLTKGDFEK